MPNWPRPSDEAIQEAARALVESERLAEDRLADKIAEKVTGRLSERSAHEQCVPRSQWLSDCETLLTAAMFGSAPGGWNRERQEEFQRELAEIETRMRRVADELRTATTS